MNFIQARAAMVDSQLRPNGLRDPKLIATFAAIPRELFVPNEQKPLTYSEASISVEVEKDKPRRYLLAPMTLAKLLQSVEPTSNDRALVVGGLTGYGTAILSRVCKNVIALETSQALVNMAIAALAAAEITNVSMRRGGLTEGYSQDAPYNVIVVEGAVAEEPVSLFTQLAEGGRLVAIVGARNCGQVYVFTKIHGIVSGHAICDASADYLPGFEKQHTFVF